MSDLLAYADAATSPELRDAYLARRRSQLYDGNPPDEEDSADQR